MGRAKSRCALCKCLNLVAEGKKHPSRDVWAALERNYLALKSRDAEALGAICEAHRLPLRFNYDFLSVADFIDEVLASMERLLRATAFPRRSGERGAR